MKNIKLKILLMVMMLIGSNLLGDGGPKYPVYPYTGTPILQGQSLIASGGDVSLTFVGKGSAAFENLLFLASPSTDSLSPYIFNNQVTKVGTVFDLGYFSKGTVLTFGIFVKPITTAFFSGTGYLNSDGAVHAYLEKMGGSTYVGFEDMPSFYSDFNYLDLQFTVTRTTCQTIPEPYTATVAILGGFVMHFLIRGFRRICCTKI